MAVEVSRTGNTAHPNLGVWYEPEQGHFHITVKAVEGFHPAITGDPESRRGKPNVSANLAKPLE